MLLAFLAITRDNPIFDMGMDITQRFRVQNKNPAMSRRPSSRCSVGTW